MTARTDWHRTLRVATALALGLASASCRGAADTRAAGTPTEGGPVSGRITVEGSSTVFPVSRIVAERFQHVHPGASVALESTSTADGFNKLCAGRLDVAAASRPINAAEIQACRTGRIEFIELPVAFDSLAVVVNPRNTFAGCLTVSELKRTWEPEAEGRVSRWSDIRREFPPQPLALFGPGNTLGTFHYFTLAIVGTQGRSRADYTTSDDDSFLANAVAADPNGLGYFGYAYYLANRDRLKAVGIDNGRGCVVPSPGTVADETYQPLTRPIFLYIRLAALDRPEVAAFARFAVSLEHAAAVQQVGYMPLPPVTLLTVAKHLDTRVTGSIFGGGGAVLGVTADAFADEEHVKNALVR
jgi:phosphate transport system substrate-binding protein